MACGKGFFRVVSFRWSSAGRSALNNFFSEQTQPAKMNAVRTQPPFPSSASKHLNNSFTMWLGIWFVIIGELLGGRAVASLVLENSRTRLVFNETNGCLVELASPDRGCVYLASGVAVPLLGMQIWDRENGAVVLLPGGPAAFRGATKSRDALRLAYTLAEGRITSDCKVGLEHNGITRWQVRVQNKSPFSIVAVTFPNIPAQIGHDSADDVLIFPLVYGERQFNPLRLGGARRAYPGPASMPWMDLYDADGGLYVASYDQTCQSTDVSALPFPTTDPKALLLSFTKFGLIAPGQTWKSSEFIVAPHDGDWHWAADQYRQWRDTWMKRPRSPRWLRDSDGWYGVGYHAGMKGGLTGSYAETLPDAAARAVELGLNHLEVWGQMIAPRPAKHNCGLYPAADPAQGGGEELARVNRQLRQQGFHVGYYMHAWASSPGLPTLIPESVARLPAEETVPSWKVTDPKAQWANAAGQIDTSHVRVMCPSALSWQKYLHYWVVDRYVRQYQSTGMYLDVLSIHHDRCFSEHHGPLHIGDWGRNALRILRTLRKEGAKGNPDFFLAGEGVCDVYGQYVDAQLISRSCMEGSWVAHPLPELIRYTCPDLLLLEGFANGVGPVPGTQQMATPEYVIQHAHLFGNRFDGYDNGDPKAFTYLKRALALRRQFKSFLYRARFRDHVGLTVSAGLQAKWFAAPQGPDHGTLITLVNAKQRPDLAVALSGLPPKVDWKATVYALDAQPQSLTAPRTGGTVRFLAPTNEMSAVWLRP